MKSASKINIHRYCNKVALSVGEQDTQYLSQELAAQLAATLNEAVVDIEHRPFVNSRFESRELVEQGVALPKEENAPEIHPLVAASRVLATTFAQRSSDAFVVSATAWQAFKTELDKLSRVEVPSSETGNLVSTLETIHANAAESPEWIRAQIDKVLPGL